MLGNKTKKEEKQKMKEDKKKEGDKWLGCNLLLFLSGGEYVCECACVCVDRWKLSSGVKKVQLRVGSCS